MTTEVMEIIGLAYRISTETKTDVIAFYYGHANSIHLDIYIDGFDKNKDSKKYNISLDQKPFQDEITPTAAIKLLKELLKRG